MMRLHFRHYCPILRKLPLIASAGVCWQRATDRATVSTFDGSAGHLATARHQLPPGGREDFSGRGSGDKGLGIEAALAIGAATLLAACASPFAQPLTYNSKPVDAAGTITLSDPKLFTREMLINERSDEVNWINQLLKDSQDPTKVKFGADMTRETEQTAAFAASVSGKLDPTARLNSRRAQETSDLQQQIDVLKLRNQLEQLQHDTDLLRTARADQTSPLNADLGKLGTGTVGPASSSVTAPSIADLKTNIDSTLSALQGRLDKVGVLPVEANVALNPFDDFRDRTAYRDLLKSARNASALDEAHDANASRLLRLNFQAMVQPNPSLPRSLGAVQIRVIPPDRSEPSQAFFDQWLENENLEPSNRDAVGRFLANGEIAALLETGFFELDSPYGVQTIVPHLQDDTEQGFTTADIDRVAKWLDTDLWKDDQVWQHAAGILSDSKRRDGLWPVLCAGMGAASQPLRDAATDVKTYALVSGYRKQAFRYRNSARNLAARLGQNAPLIDDRIVARYKRAGDFLQTMQDSFGGYPSCARYLAGLSEPFEWSVIAKGGFGLRGSDVHVYDIGPREQVERVSTVARAANWTCNGFAPVTYLIMPPWLRTRAD